MKIIDEKGKLFGKINIIDFLVILFFFCLLPIFYFGYKVLTKKPIQVEKPRQVTDVNISCKFIKVEPQTLEQIKVGDKEINDKGVVTGEIIWIGDSSPYQYKFNIGSGELINMEDSVLKELFARIKLKAEIKENGLFFNSTQVLINSPIVFKTNKYEITFLPVREGSEKQEIKEIKEIKELDLFATFKGLSEDAVQLISIGDEELDSEGNVIAKILNIGTPINDTFEVNLGANNFINVEDSTKKQIIVRLRLKTGIGNNGQIYFNNQQLTNNSPFVFKTDKYEVKGIVSEKEVIKEKWAKLRVKFTGLMPELATLVKQGDVDKDRDGNVKGRIKDVISNKPANISVLTILENKYITLQDPYQKEIIAILDLLCKEKNGILYFKDYPIKVGNIINFTADIYSMSGTIIGLEN